MRESGRRVALLARPGAARERLRAALTEVGADLALEADPTQVDVGELTGARPEVVIVALDSVSESAIDRLDAVLLDPAIDVMFEEADVAANRSGWDAARWVRHLAAKLHRHDDVLPPGASVDAPAAAPGAPTDAAAVAAAASGDTGFEQAATLAATPEAAPGGGLSWSPDALPMPVEPLPAHPLAEEFTPGVEPGGYAGFDPVAAEMVDAEFNADQVIAFEPLQDGFSLDETHAPADLPALDLVFESEIALSLDPGMPAQSLQFGELTLDDLRGDAGPPLGTPESGLDFDIAALDAPGTRDERPSFGELSLDAAEPMAMAPPTAPSFAGVSGGHVLELVADDAPAVPAATGSAGGTQRVANLEDLERRIASLELVEERPDASGAVVLVAGIGGPDAVRQLLGALPEGFPRPIVVQQRLDGGRYDRLVAQMQRATPLPVDLAEPGSALRAGVVYMLPAGVGIASGPDGLCFDDSGRALDALPPADSAVVLLSGSDAALVEMLSGAAWSGALVAGQAAEGCYDAAASTELAARGRPTAQPAELAQRLARRWSAA